MPTRVSVVTGQFEDLLALGLNHLLTAEPSVRLIAHNVRMEDMSGVLQSERPTVVLLNFGALPSIATVRQLRDDHPESRFVVMASRPSATEANQMLGFGATACVAKDTEARDIVNAIHLASRGMQVIPHASPSGGGAELLTPREAEVLELLQDGLSNAEIALDLSIGIETVRTHARNIYSKLGVSSRRDLARLSSRTRSPA